jgi:hypothetical protein
MKMVVRVDAGRLGGQSKSAAKIAAVRENVKKAQEGRRVAAAKRRAEKEAHALLAVL